MKKVGIWIVALVISLFTLSANQMNVAMAYTPDPTIQPFQPNELKRNLLVMFEPRVRFHLARIKGFHILGGQTVANFSFVFGECVFRNCPSIWSATATRESSSKPWRLYGLRASTKRATDAIDVQMIHMIHMRPLNRGTFIFGRILLPCISTIVLSIDGKKSIYPLESHSFSIYLPGDKNYSIKYHSIYQYSVEFSLSSWVRFRPARVTPTITLADATIKLRTPKAVAAVARSVDSKA